MENRYGNATPLLVPSIMQKRKDTCMAKYGFPNPSMHPDVRKKVESTCIERYGSPHIMPSYTLKEFTFPCGATIQVQGYEPYCLTDFLTHGTSEDDIIIGYDQLPTINYEYEGKR